jgi:hypothetical protein
MYFHLNNIHNEHNFFDSMYQFWLECFRIENAGGCTKQEMKMKRHLISFMLTFLCLSIILIIYFIWKYFQNKKKGHLLSRQSPTALLPYLNRVSA